MEKKHYVVMGAGEVGFHLARTLSQEGHDVVVIEPDLEKRDRVEDELDAAVVVGNAASGIAKKLGAERTVVRVGVAEDVTTHRRIYEEVFGADLLLSTQVLSTTRIMNHILGHNTLAVEYLARGKVQLRRIQLEEGSILTKKCLKDIEMPAGSLVVASTSRPANR